MILVVDLLSRLLAALPRPAALAVGRGLGWVLASVVRYRRRYVADTLARCFPERPAAERRRIQRRMYGHLGMTVVEQMRVSIRGLEEYRDRITLHGEQHFSALQEAGCPTLLLSAHLGNWELCGYLAQSVSQRITVVVRPLRGRGMNTYLARTRERMGVDFLPATTSFRECLKRARQGEVVAMVLDQNTRRSRGVFVEFFGQPACTTFGLALLAAESGAHVYPIFTLRRDDRRYELHVLDPIAPPPDRKRDTLRTFTQDYTRVIEEMIRRYPEQWIWIHRRWRTQPVKKDADG